MAQIFSYNTTAALPCRGCGQGFKEEDGIVLFDNRRFHILCFKCGTCKKQLTTDSEAEAVRDIPYCKGRCAWAAAQTVCGGCGQVITDTYLDIKQLHKKYHKECFKCVKCGQPIQGGFRKSNEKA